MSTTSLHRGLPIWAALLVVAALILPNQAAAWSGIPTDGDSHIIAPGANGGTNPFVWTMDEFSRVTTYFTSPDTYAKLEDPDPDDPDGDPDPPTPGLIFTSSFGLTVVGTTALAVVLTMVAVDALAAENYLRENAVALRHDLRRGAGPTLEDLAHLWGIPKSHYPRFARQLQEHRHKILPHLGHPLQIDGDDAYAFMLSVSRAIVWDRRLTAATGTDSVARAP